MLSVPEERRKNLDSERVAGAKSCFPGLIPKENPVKSHDTFPFYDLKISLNRCPGAISILKPQV